MKPGFFEIDFVEHCGVAAERAFVHSHEVNSDNDSAFINDTVVEFCRAYDLQFTRSRHYRKNDQAWVQPKNGAVVRRLLGYGRLARTGCHHGTGAARCRCPRGT